MALIQFVTMKHDEKYHVVGVRSVNISDRALIAEYDHLEDAQAETSRLERIPQSPWSEEREQIFNGGEALAPFSLDQNSPQSNERN